MKDPRTCIICGREFIPPEFYALARTCTGCAHSEGRSAGLRLDGLLVEMNRLVDDTGLRPVRHDLRAPRCRHGFYLDLCVVPTCKHWDGKETEGKNQRKLRRRNPQPCETCGEHVTKWRSRTGRRFCSAKCEAKHAS